MKSAYELALERTGGALNDVSVDIKQKIAQIETLYNSKIAEAELSAQEKIQKSGIDLEYIKTVKEGFEVEKASLKSKMEQEKNAVRRQQK